KQIYIPPPPNSGSLKLVQQPSNFIQFVCTSGYGGAVYLFINNEGQVTITNSIFYQCNGIIGGGIGVSIESGGKLTIDGQCNFTECNALIGGGIYVEESGINSKLILDDGIIFEGCYTSFSEPEFGGGGIYIYFTEQGSMIVNNVQFKDCNAFYGGGIIIDGYSQAKLIFNGTQFTQCYAYQGGGIYVNIQIENSILELIGVIFEQCEAIMYDGGGIYVNVGFGVQFILSEICQFKDCYAGNKGGGLYLNNYESQFQVIGFAQFLNCESSFGGGILIQFSEQSTIDIQNISLEYCISIYGGGIYSDLNDYGTLNIKDTTFDSCTCTQPGNGGGLYLYQGISSIISITNSSFINCNTISNSYYQKYGWGGAIYIQTSITAENLNESNFIMRNLTFNGCSAVNSIGNNLHICSINTLTTGLAIKNGNLLTVIDLSNHPNIISDLYTSMSYAYDYMGINESLETSNPGTINPDLHNTLFEQSFIYNVSNPTY
ncbi:MAG: hypothetical protein EZS28_044580, partial [Streblomastix strix]